MTEKPFDLDKVLADVEKSIADCKAAPDWASQDNILARVEAIRLRAYRDILALGFEEMEMQVDVSINPADDMSIFHLAKELKWKPNFHWYEPACPTDGGEITIYYEAEGPVL